MLIELLERNSVTRQPRSYIGCSSIGHECDRYLWLNYHKPIKETITYQQNKIFKRGDLEEDVLLRDLAKQPEVEIVKTQVELAAGDLKGHADGIIRVNNDFYILEIKTMNNRNWQQFQKHGLKKTKPIYWAQCQVYMGMSNIHKAVLLATNKDNEEAHEEIILFDKDQFAALVLRAKRLKTQTEEPDGLTYYSKPPFTCTFCPRKEHCWERNSR